MGKSGNPAKNAASQVSSVSDFKKKKGGGIFELPSGLVMKLRNPGGLGLFLDAGMIPNSLMPVVDKALKGEKVEDTDLIDPEKGIDSSQIADMMSLIDGIMMKCAIEPRVHPVPEDEDDRDDDSLYIDEIEDEDKMFVFQWVSGGTTDLERFRERHSADMATLGGSIPMELPSK